MPAPRLMAVLAHPDDESLGVGGTLAKYATEGVEVFLLTATRGDGGRYRGFRVDDERHPGPEALAVIREGELRAAASVLGIHDVALLDYRDQQLDRADPRRAIADIAAHLRRVRPDVVVTFAPDGVRSSGSPREFAVHDRRDRRRRRSRGPQRRRRRRLAARGREAVLHRVAGFDMGRLRIGDAQAGVDRRRRRAAGDAMARMGADDDD